MYLRDLFDEFPLSKSDVVPLALQKLLRTPLNVTENWAKAEQLLLEAQTSLPESLELRVALYKMYAYSNRFDESLALINEVMSISASKGNFDADWMGLDRRSTTWDHAQGAVRYYLYSMKAMGFVLLRKGEVMAAYEVLKKLSELDLEDQVGGSVVYDIAERLSQHEDEEIA